MTGRGGSLVAGRLATEKKTTNFQMTGEKSRTIVYRKCAHFLAHEITQINSR